jgi:hypothetical protein
MPADRTLAEDMSRELVDLYARAEVRIAADLARRLAAGLGQPRWAEEKLAATGQLRRALVRILGTLQRDTEGAATQALADAYERGGQSGLDELLQLGRAGSRAGTDVRRALPGAETIQRLARSLAGRLEGTYLPVLRWSLDAYRTVIGTVSPDIALGIATRRQAAQSAWEDLLDRGVTGFVDRAGRRWNLATYVEMATRTGVAQAAVEGHLDRLASVGLDLVIVSNAAMECSRCRPWEGKVLVRGGDAGPHTVVVEHATRDDYMIKVKVAGSVARAVDAGLLHPQCRHSLSAYLPGVTRAITNTEDPEGEAARERLRDLERKVRRAKIKAAAVIDPDAVAGHRSTIRDLQAQIREHVTATEHLGVRRKPERERINLGHTNPPAKAQQT